MNDRNVMEVRFVQLMSQLFQLDEAERLDFGIYRIIKRHNLEVQEFLGEVVSEGGNKVLRGGKLSEIIEKAFTVEDDEQTAGDRYRIQGIEKKLGLSLGLPAEALNAKLSELEKIPATKDLVEEYRSRKEHLAASGTAEADRMEVFNRLYQFFDRHYQDGDFIVERRYGKDGSRYIRSTGDDTEFHFATEDMYYIKSGDIFTDFPVSLSYGQQIVFTLDPETLEKTRSTLRPTDKAHYELHEVTRNEQGQVIVVLKYLKNAQTDKEKERIAVEVHKACGGDPAEIKRWLNQFIARNQSDFFIHKRLKETLTEDLDIFIKTEVLDADQLMGGGDLPQRMIKVGRVVRQIGLQIIDFLAVLEDFQRRLWEKKKLVFETRYVITLDRIATLAGEEWLTPHLDAIIEGQQAEWEELGLGTISRREQCRGEKESNLFTKSVYRWLPLPVDTANFDEAFKWDLLAAVTARHPLDDAIDGLAIHSDNWQALNTLQLKYGESVKCIYIDPPYNTKSSGIPYKNGYRHASWGAMMFNQLQMLHRFISRDGAIFVSIDKTERTLLEHTLDGVFGTGNRIEELVWAMNTTNSQLPNYSTNHEYVEVYAKHRPTVEQETDMFREQKPGFAEVMELVESLNPEYPLIQSIEERLKELYQQHRMEYQEEIESKGLEWDDEKGNDPWKGLYNYSRAEYRDPSGSFVEEAQARERQASIWIWRESDISMPATKQAESTRDPDHPNWRFYTPNHPVTGKPCPHPKSGWKFPYSNGIDSLETRSFLALEKDNRIAWGKNEKKVPQVKRMLHEVESNIGKSVFTDYSDGEKQTSAMFGKSGVFLAPKHTHFVSRFIRQATRPDSQVLDSFGGSGSSADAVIRVNRVDKTRRRFITVEVNQYFETLIVPRLKKAGAATTWQKGKARSLDGPGLFMRVQALEQYEDTLENLDTGDRGQLDLKFYDPAFTLRYGLNQESKEVYCAIGHFRSPFGYQLQRVEGGGKAPLRPVDLVESLVYLMGLRVNRMIREPEGVLITGSDPRNRSVAVFFRDCDHENTMAWVEQKLQEHPADQVVTNDPASLHFEGCERFEAIESFFAGQFGGR
jgi:adenine-specific DNA-methyltransferase